MLEVRSEDWRVVIQGYVGVVIFMLCFSFIERKHHPFLYLSNATVFGLKKAVKKDLLNSNGRFTRSVDLYRGPLDGKNTSSRIKNR